MNSLFWNVSYVAGPHLTWPFTSENTVKIKRFPKNHVKQGIKFRSYFSRTNVQRVIVYSQLYEDFAGRIQRRSQIMKWTKIQSCKEIVQILVPEIPVYKDETNSVCIK